MSAIAAIAIDDNHQHLSDLAKLYPPIKTHCFTITKRGFGDATRVAVDRIIKANPNVLVLDLKLQPGGSHKDVIRVIKKTLRSKSSAFSGVHVVIWTSFSRNARSDLLGVLNNLFVSGASSVRVHQKPDFPPIPLPPVAFPGQVNFFDATKGKYTT